MFGCQKMQFFISVGQDAVVGGGEVKSWIAAVTAFTLRGNPLYNMCSTSSAHVWGIRTKRNEKECWSVLLRGTWSTCSR